MPVCLLSNTHGESALDTYQIVHPGAEKSLDRSSKIEGYRLSSKCPHRSCRRASGRITARVFPERFGRDLYRKDAFDVSWIIEGHSPGTICPSRV